MKLTVTRKQHTHRGVTYRPGEEFEGTERLLKTHPDRLAAADKPKRGRPRKVEPQEAEVMPDADTTDSE